MYNTAIVNLNDVDNDYHETIKYLELPQFSTSRKYEVVIKLYCLRTFPYRDVGLRYEWTFGIFLNTFGFRKGSPVLLK